MFQSIGIIMGGLVIARQVAMLMKERLRSVVDVECVTRG